MRKDDGHDEEKQIPVASGAEDTASHISATPTQGFATPAYATYDHLGMALVCISGGGEFDTIRGWCDGVTQVLLDSPK